MLAASYRELMLRSKTGDIMWDFLRRHLSKDQKPDVSLWMLEFSQRVYSDINDIFVKEGELFIAQAAAVFALQQDMKAAIRLDLRKFDDVPQGLAEDYAGVSRGTKYPDRLDKALDSLRRIARSNEEMLRQTSEGTTSWTQANLAVFRMNAANVWLLTSLSKTLSCPSVVDLTVCNIWLKLHSVSVDEIASGVVLFTGDYFEGISCEHPRFDDWAN